MKKEASDQIALGIFAHCSQKTYYQIIVVKPFGKELDCLSAEGLCNPLVQTIQVVAGENRYVAVVAVVARYDGLLKLAFFVFALREVHLFVHAIVAAIYWSL